MQPAATRKALSLTPLWWRSACLGALAAAGLASTACGEDEPEPPPPPPELRIQAVSQVGSARIEPAAGTTAIELSCDAARPLLVEVGPNPDAETNPECARNQAACPRPGTLENWRLQPLEACGTASNCGYLLALLQDAQAAAVRSAESTLTSVLLPLPEVSSPTVYTVRVELRDGSGEPVLGADGEPVAASAEVELIPALDCPLPDAGAGDAEAEGGDAMDGDGGVMDASSE